MGRDFIKNSGFYRFLVGDGFVIIAVGFFGGFFNIIYGENIGVMVIIKVYSIWVILWAVILVILFLFV